MRKTGWMLSGTAGVAAIVATAWFLRDRNTEQPDYDVLVDDGALELRDYPALIVAETRQRGPRRAALARGQATLADYLAGRGRTGPKIGRTAPLLVDRTGSGQWRTRCIMPARWTHAALPPPGSYIAIVDIPARRIASHRLGRATDEAALAESEAGLAAWLAAQELSPAGPAEYALYSSPLIPGALKRSEVWLPV